MIRVNPALDRMKPATIRRVTKAIQERLEVTEAQSVAEFISEIRTGHPTFYKLMAADYELSSRVYQRLNRNRMQKYVDRVDRVQRYRNMHGCSLHKACLDLGFASSNYVKWNQHVNNLIAKRML